MIARVLVLALNKAHSSDMKARTEAAAVVARLEGHIALTR